MVPASRPPRSAPLAWIIVAHVLGGIAIGGLEAARLHRVGVGLAVVPIAAATGLVAGALIALAQHVVKGRAWWLAALGIAAPSLLVTVPVASTLFEGAFAQTLPVAGALPVLLPVVGWLGLAVVVAVGRRLMRATDLITRSIALLAAVGALGGIVWVERHVLGAGYPGAHIGATIAVIVLAGVAIRVLRVDTVSPYLAAVIAALVIGTAAASTFDGLRAPADRYAVATLGDQSRDLVTLWRKLADRDGDGSSPLLGGGDCDDRDPERHPGAPDKPGDGIDADCDGADAAPPPPLAAPPPPEDLAGWRSDAAVTTLLAKTRKMNVLLVTVDALRFDMLAKDTPDRAEFPNLVALLADSVWFTRAIAPASGTDLSLGTLLTGRIDPFQAVAWTLPEAMQNLGRKTTAVLPAEVHRYVGDTLLDRGVERVRVVHSDWQKADVGDHVSAGATTAEGVKAIDDAGSAPFFLWLHYFDVHEHHQIDVPKELRAAIHTTGNKKRDTYRALLFAIDREVGRVRTELATRGLADHTIIVFASDHGESLGDDPRLGDTHGKVVYSMLTRIPIAIHVPGVAPGERTDPVTLVDLAPTLLGLLGDANAMAPLDGLDLLPALLDAPAALRPAAKRPLTIHEENQWGVVEWPLALVVRPADDVVELYDLVTDPGQQSNLATQRPDDVSRLRAQFAATPQVKVDRTIDGRRSRERQAQPPPNRVPRAAATATPTP